MSIVIVTAAIMFENDKLLITQRKAGVNEGLKWEFPGGKLEENETPHTSLVREIKEELNLDIEVGDIFDVVYHKYPTITILMLVYNCKLLGGEIEAIDCNDYEWIELSEMKNYTFAQADIPIVEKILKQSKHN